MPIAPVAAARADSPCQDFHPSVPGWESRLLHTLLGSQVSSTSWFLGYHPHPHGFLSPSASTGLPTSSIGALPRLLSGKEPASANAGDRCGFHSWVGKKSHGQKSLVRLQSMGLQPVGCNRSPFSTHTQPSIPLRHT